MNSICQFKIASDLALRAFQVAAELKESNPTCPHIERLYRECLKHYTRQNDIYLESLESKTKIRFIK